MKIRTIITQDAEVDDQNSLRHFLFYANEVELQGIVQTSSKFHWRGIPGANTVPDPVTGDFAGDGMPADFSERYRWTGIDWMQRVIDDYAADYPNLCRHADGYPTPEYLRSITKIGNVGYRGEMEAPSEGSELIRERILDGDPRPLYIQVWGGCNTIARALMDIQAAHQSEPDWAALRERLMQKIVITACGEQDETYRSYIAEEWPRIRFVKTLQMRSYAYLWFVMPEGESKDTLRAAFMKPRILDTGSALTAGYRTWRDGVYYEGEPAHSQFGANPNIASDWFGGKHGLPSGEKYDFLSEGDSPTFFPLLDWGFRTLEDFSWGGIAGRYHRVESEKNSRGEALDLWDVSRDAYTDPSGSVHETESMWPYVADIQRDFAARAAWAASSSREACDHPPRLTVTDGLDRSCAPGQTLTLRACASSEDGSTPAVTWRIYPEASASWACSAVLNAGENEAALTIPAAACPGDRLHVIVKAQSDGSHRLVHYAQIVVTIS